MSTGDQPDLATLPCPRCGYDLRAHERFATCPECGSPHDLQKLRRYIKLLPERLLVDLWSICVLLVVGGFGMGVSFYAMMRGQYAALLTMLLGLVLVVCALMWYAATWWQSLEISRGALRLAIPVGQRKRVRRWILADAGLLALVVASSVLVVVTR